MNLTKIFKKNQKIEIDVLGDIYMQRVTEVFNDKIFTRNLNGYENKLSGVGACIDLEVTQLMQSKYCDKSWLLYEVTRIGENRIILDYFGIVKILDNGK